MTKKRSKNRRNFVAIPFVADVSLGALANAGVISIATLDAQFGEDIFIISVDCLFTIRGLTGTEVPIVVGFAHSDLTVGEIVEALGAELTDPDDIIQKERARRPVRRVGSISNVDPSNLMDGKLIRQKIKFMVGDGHNLDFFAQNRSGAVLTTGATLTCDGTIYGRWQR